MHPGIVRHLISPALERLCGRRTFQVYRQLAESQWFARHELRHLQLRKLRTLFDIANEHTDYAAFANQPADFKLHSLDDLRALPLLSKDDIREHLDALTNRNVPGGPIGYRTGGSGGKPLQFYFDKRRQAFDKAARMRTHDWFGCAPGCREAYVWNAPVELSKQDRVKRLRDWMTNETLLPASELSPLTVGWFVGKMRRFRPRCVFGYPSSMVQLCELAADAGEDLRALNLACVFSTAETLLPHYRATLEEAFGCPVADGYGSREAGFIAHQCPHGSMHITSENVIVEIVDPAGNPLPPGEDGEIVVTQLDCHATLFIRYRTGDVGRLSAGECSCGRGLDILDAVHGRVNDFLIMPDSRRVHSSALHAALSGLAGIEQFQFHQTADGAVEMRLVATSDFSAEAALRENLQTRLGGETPLTITRVDAIAPSPSGKFRYIISERNF
ncbi:MAG: phenylacetate--CoA ligase family protein [Phycisphaerales bacterium]|nr:phenylacetate--CoA ligase family protein [Phycisphaerales bacterium]MBT7171942.1 phenylacetate--CoA ligase family protein [Phycisphaerales bacterium]